MKEHKKAAHRSEKWQVSPKFEKHSKISIENICKDVVAELIESCLEIIFEDDIADPSNDAPDQAAASSVLGVWVADPNLPEGWKTCVISRGKPQLPEKRMFYSPCGKLFTNRVALDRFFGDQKKVKEKQNDKKIGKLENKTNSSQVFPESEVIRAADLCMPKMEAPDSEEDVSDAISLSDDDFEDVRQPQSKRKYPDYETDRKCPKSKKIKRSNLDDYSYSPTLTPAQEKILIGSYEEWPVPFPGLVDRLTKETDLPAERIEDWFERRTDCCLRMLFGSVV